MDNAERRDRSQPKQPYAEVLAQRRPWKLGTVLAWVIWGKVECLDRITNYSQWDWYGSHALDAWRQVLSKIHDGQLVPVEQGRPQGRHEWFDVLDTQAGAEIAFNRMITFDREEVRRLWRSREETEKLVGRAAVLNPVDVGEIPTTIGLPPPNSNEEREKIARKALEIVAERSKAKRGLVPSAKVHTGMAVEILRKEYGENISKRCEIYKIAKADYASFRARPNENHARAKKRLAAGNRPAE